MSTRFLIALCLLFGATCTTRRAPATPEPPQPPAPAAPAPAPPLSPTPATPESPDSVDVWAVQQPLSREEVDSIRAVGIRVDTIIVTPEVITLRVGEFFSRGALSVRALDAAGEPVPGFKPGWLVSRSTPQVYRFEPAGLRALAAGEGVLYVVAFPPTTSRPERAFTAVRVVVRP